MVTMDATLDHFLQYEFGRYSRQCEVVTLYATILLETSLNIM